MLLFISLLSETSVKIALFLIRNYPLSGSQSHLTNDLPPNNGLLYLLDQLKPFFLTMLTNTEYLLIVDAQYNRIQAKVSHTDFKIRAGVLENILQSKF